MAWPTFVVDTWLLLTVACTDRVQAGSFDQVGERVCHEH
jgi:hypothetical protein